MPHDSLRLIAMRRAAVRSAGACRAPRDEPRYAQERAAYIPHVAMPYEFREA